MQSAYILAFSHNHIIICVMQVSVVFITKNRLNTKLYMQFSDIDAEVKPRRGTGVYMLRAIDGLARSIDRAAPSMDPLIAHLSVDRAIIDRSRNYRNCANDQLRTAEFGAIDRSRSFRIGAICRLLAYSLHACL